MSALTAVSFPVCVWITICQRIFRFLFLGVTESTKIQLNLQFSISSTSLQLVHYLDLDNGSRFASLNIKRVLHHLIVDYNKAMAEFGKQDPYSYCAKFERK